ncbi:Ycf66 family protein [Aerosakkonemataceae cyanobacterium BLCC-F154]|uniref:Ycf66 family protein n=1 Tax=Floridaenema fluviatile BLCC-F154 TaxID=3153640 RepID=A0ABV4YC29_9CYAN
MLAYILALVVGTGSLGIYLAAFFLPEIHRKSDFYWSGVGLFYALVLWICAGRITGGVLLGQVASVALLGWFGWQTLTLRRELIPKAQQTELPSTEEATEKVLTQAKDLTENLKSQASKVSLPGGVAQLPQKLTGLFTNLKGKAGAKAKTAKASKVPPTVAKPAETVTPPVITETTGDTTIVSATSFDEDFPEQLALETETPEATAEKSSEVEVTLNVEVVPPKETTDATPPNPPDSKLVEEAVADAEDKNLPSSPPESPFNKIEKSGS